MEIKLVVFDMAGTTVEDNNYVAKAFQKAFVHYGHNISTENINLAMGYAKPVAIKKVLEQYHIEANSDLIEKIHRRFVDEMVSFYKTDKQVKEKNNTSFVFDSLRKNNIKIAIDTGFSRVIANAVFERLGWQQSLHYDVSITSDEVANGRPHPDMIYKAMDSCGITDASVVAKVGDTVSDLQQGTAAGCKYVIGVSTGAYSKEELSREAHTHLINDLKELLPLLHIENHTNP